MAELVSLFLAGHPPIDTWWHEFKPGLTVMYGRNGVGKTRLLRALCELGVPPRKNPGTSSVGYELIVRDPGTVLVTQSLESLVGLKDQGDYDCLDSTLQNLEWACEELGDPYPQHLGWAFQFAKENLLAIRSSLSGVWFQGVLLSDLTTWVATERRDELRAELDKVAQGSSGIEPTSLMAELQRQEISPDRLWDGVLLSGLVERPLPADFDDWEPSALDKLKFKMFRRSPWMLSGSALAEFTHSEDLWQEVPDEADALPPMWAAVSVGLLGGLSRDRDHGLVNVVCDPLALEPQSKDQSEELGSDEDLERATGAYLAHRLDFEAHEDAEEEYWDQWSKAEEAGEDPTQILFDYDVSLYKEGSWPIEPNPELELYAQQLAERANEFASLLLQDSPPLTVRFEEADQLDRRLVCRWAVADLATADTYGLDGLSEAQHRWCTFAIRLAIADVENRRQLVVIDEPEMGLHVTAKRHLARGLRKLAERLNIPVIVASHSPELINDPETRLIHVFRDRQNVVRTRDLPAPTLQSADELGLDRSDVFNLTQRFVIVEGEHDLLALRAILGNELDRLGALLIPMHGTRNLVSVIDSAIFDFTDAGVVVVLDNTAAERASALLAEVKEMAVNKSHRELDTAVRTWEKKAKAGRSPEEKKLVEFLKNLIYRSAIADRIHRIRVFGFEREDITEYLDCATLVSGQTDWAALRTRYASHSGTPWKTWLANEYAATFKPEDIVAAAQAVADHPPTEFYDLLQVIESVPDRSIR